jgi:hypothetical protein
MVRLVIMVVCYASSTVRTSTWNVLDAEKVVQKNHEGQIVQDLETSSERVREDGTFIFPGNPHDNYPQQWYPSPDPKVTSANPGLRDPIMWRPIYPELCSIHAVSHDRTNQTTNKVKVPGYQSKRIALVFRGDSFRGLSYGTSIHSCTKKGDGECEESQSKLPFYCTDEAVVIQQATANAQLKLMVR